MFTVGDSPVAKKLAQTRCPPTQPLGKDVMYIYKMENYLVIRGTKSCVLQLEIIMLNDINQFPKNKCPVFSLIHVAANIFSSEEVHNSEIDIWRFNYCL